MKKTFRCTVKFDLSKPEVVKCIEENFDEGWVKEDGTAVTGSSRFNSRSTENSAIKYFTDKFNFFPSLKGNFKIIEVHVKE